MTRKVFFFESSDSEDRIIISSDISVQRVKNENFISFVHDQLANPQGAYSQYRLIFDVNSDNASFIRNIILAYPEVQVFFKKNCWKTSLFKTSYDSSKSNIEDLKKICRAIIENGTTSEEVQDEIFRHILELYNNSGNKKIIQKAYRELLKTEARDKVLDSFHFAGEKKIDYYHLAERDNLFDVSNLRYATKKFKFIDQSLNENYSSFYETRADNIAYVVDEESAQCKTLSYLMHANGFRALPITSKYLLLESCNLRLKGQKGIIIRDFDLQFCDENDEYPEEKMIVTEREGGGEELHKVDFIRGFIYRNDKWENLLLGCAPYTCQVVCERYNPYWHLSEYSSDTYCVSQGYDNLCIKKNASGWRIITKDDKDKLEVPGIKKPVVGIYEDINAIICRTKFLGQIMHSKGEMDRTRVGHNHSVPLDLYNHALSLCSRAERYFDREEFILSAVLSQEVIELLNGYHTSLGLLATLVHAKSENAIAMNVLGCNENLLAKDCQTRVELTYQDVSRMVSGTTYDKNNILNQIFSDCRQYCKEKEHFKSEEVFIDAMAKLNDGIVWKGSKQMWEDMKTKISNGINYIKDYGKNNL